MRLPSNRRLIRLIDLNELHPELAKAVQIRPPFGRMIDHPLVQLMNLDLPFPWDDDGTASSWAEFANEALAEKQKDVSEAIGSKNWRGYVLLHERAYRFDALRKLIDDKHATRAELWPVVGAAWSDSENIWQYQEEWLALWSGKCSSKHMAMDETDQKARRALPARLTVYRGVNCDDDSEAAEAIGYGLSWTLDREQAVWFANRGSSRPFLGQAEILKRDCFAYFSDRNEQEVVVDPAKLKKVETTKLRKKRVR